MYYYFQWHSLSAVLLSFTLPSHALSSQKHLQSLDLCSVLPFYIECWLEAKHMSAICAGELLSAATEWATYGHTTFLVRISWRMRVWFLLRFDMTSFSVLERTMSMPHFAKCETAETPSQSNVATAAEGKSVHRICIYEKISTDTSFVNIGHLAYKFPIVSVVLACLPST